MTDAKAASGQLCFDFSEAEKRDILRRARLPSVEISEGPEGKVKVSSKCLRAVLNCVVGHTGKDKAGWAWPSEQTIADLTEYKPRQVKRAIFALEKVLGVLIVQRRKNPKGTTSNHYLLVRSELALLATRENQSAIGTDQSATRTDQSAIGADQSATSGTRTEGTEKEENPGPVPEEPRAETAESDLTVLDMSDASFGPRLNILRPRLAVIVENLPCEWQSSADGRTLSMLGSVFHPLRDKHLSDTRAILEWHRRQLSAPSPVFGPTEADSIMAVAVALYAARYPTEQVKRSRVAIFANVTAHRAFSRVLRYLPEAIAAVDSLRCPQTVTAG